MVQVLTFNNGPIFPFLEDVNMTLHSVFRDEISNHLACQRAPFVLSAITIPTWDSQDTAMLTVTS